MIVAYGTGLQNLLTAPRQESSPTTSTGLTGEYAKEGVRNDRETWENNEIALDWASTPHFGLSFCAHWERDNAGWYDSGYVFGLYDESGTPIIAIKSDTGESLNFYEYVTSSSPTTFKDFYVYTDNTIVNRIDVHCLIDDTNGYFRFYFNGVLGYEINGDTTRGGVLTGASYAKWGGQEDFEYQTISNIFVTDGDDPREIVMYQHNIMDAGRFSEMEGEYYTLRSIGKLDDTQVVASYTPEQTLTAEIENLPSQFSGYEIMCVGVDSRFAADSGGVNGMATVIDDGTNVLESATIKSDGTFNSAQTFFTTAPDGSAWDIDKINSLHVGVRSK